MGILRNRTDVIAYTIDKNINNNLFISIQNGEVVVNAPWYYTRNQIQEIVEEKKKWILERIRQYEMLKEQYSNTGTITILGKECNIKIRYRNIKTLTVNVEDRVIKIEIPNKYNKVEKDALLRLLIDKIYQVVAERELETSMEKARILLGFAPEDYKIQKMKNTLGKCTQDKTIILNPEIVKYSKSIIDYIVIHQFCHLKYKTHTKGFYQMIKKYVPDYENFIKEINGLQY